MGHYNPTQKFRVQKVGKNSFDLEKCVWANSLASRLKGLLGKTHLEDSEGLLLDPCNQVHMFFMRFPIDAVFLDSKNYIVAVESLKPWRLSGLHFKAKKVLELSHGLAARAGWQVGDQLHFIRDREVSND